MKSGLLAKMSQGHNEILSARSSMVVNQAKLAQEQLVKAKEAIVNKINLDLEKLTDLSPQSTTALTVENSLSSDPDKWVKDVHDLKVEFALATQELKIARETYNEFFPVEEAVTI